MPKFSKKIHGKNVDVYPATHKTINGERWGAQILCPWCGTTLVQTGANTPKQAAELIFNYVKVHYKNEH